MKIIPVSAARSWIRDSMLPASCAAVSSIVTFDEYFLKKWRIKDPIPL